MPSSLQSGALSLQTGTGRKRCDLHVSRSANCDTQFANWYSLQIRCASSATSLHTELLRPTVCKLRPGMQTVLRSQTETQLSIWSFSEMTNRWGQYLPGYPGSVALSSPSVSYPLLRRSNSSRSDCSARRQTLFPATRHKVFISCARVEV